MNKPTIQVNEIAGLWGTGFRPIYASMSFDVCLIISYAIAGMGMICLSITQSSLNGPFICILVTIDNVNSTSTEYRNTVAVYLPKCMVIEMYMNSCMTSGERIMQKSELATIVVTGRALQQPVIEYRAVEDNVYVRIDDDKNSEFWMEMIIPGPVVEEMFTKIKQYKS